MYEDALRIFHPGEVLETNEAPHEWFEPVNASPPKAKVTGRPDRTTKATQPKIPADKF